MRFIPDNELPEWIETEQQANGWRAEQELDARCDALAAALLDAVRALSWGSGEPLIDATYRLQSINEASGYRWQPAPTRRPESTRKPISRGVTRAVWDRDKWTCVTCGTHENLTIDHILAVANGGTNNFDNLQTMCGSCNSSKGAR